MHPSPPGGRRGLVLVLSLGAIALSGAGCAHDVDEPLLGPRAVRVGDHIEWPLEGGGVGRASLGGEQSLSIVAHREDGTQFGFTLHPDGFEEWAVGSDGRRDRLACRVEGDRELYSYNGNRFVLVAEDLERHATFGAAIRSQVHAKRPYEESLLVENPLGEALIRSLEELGRDPSQVKGIDSDLAAQIIGDDGHCSPNFLQIASLCARLKCMYGGPSNAVCNACTGALVGCAIISIMIGLGFG